MKYLHIIAVVGIVLPNLSFANAQINKTYQESCIEAQVKLHEQHKNISRNDFRSFCDCTERQLKNILGQSQFNEMQQEGKKPSGLKSAQDAAAKACLKPEPKIEA